VVAGGGAMRLGGGGRQSGQDRARAPRLRRRGTRGGAAVGSGSGRGARVAGAGGGGLGSGWWTAGARRKMQSGAWVGEEGGEEIKWREKERFDLSPLSKIRRSKSSCEGGP
jgi:hypothetical protein